LAVGIGVISSIIIKALLVISLVLGGAYALTTYVQLPRFVDAIIWIGAGGYTLLSVVTMFTVLVALAVVRVQASHTRR